VGEKLLWEEAESKTRLGKGDVQTIKATAFRCFGVKGLGIMKTSVLETAFQCLCESSPPLSGE